LEKLAEWAEWEGGVSLGELTAQLWMWAQMGPVVGTLLSLLVKDKSSWRYLQQSMAIRHSDERSTEGETEKGLLMEDSNITKKDQTS
jgi:hypothetical protein